MADASTLLQFRAQGFGQIAHGFKVIDHATVHPAHDLACSKSLLAHTGQKFCQLFQGKILKVDSCVVIHQ